MMMSAAQTIQWKVVQWLVRNEFEGVWTAPVMAKYLLQYFHLKGYGQNQSWPNICYNTFIWRGMDRTSHGQISVTILSFEGVWTEPVMAKYLLQYFHLSDWQKPIKKWRSTFEWSAIYEEEEKEEKIPSFMCWERKIMKTVLTIASLQIKNWTQDLMHMEHKCYCFNCDIHHLEKYYMFKVMISQGNISSAYIISCLYISINF
jgi:hypothetical protein